MNKIKYIIIAVFFVTLAGAYVYFDRKGAYDHKINTGKISAKVILPATSQMRGKVMYTTQRYIFLWFKKIASQKDLM
jgi:hypothetical protein